jgi:Rrf2 family transcriptional regulator, iron-sulfur cluster assembly transcription factor
MQVSLGKRGDYAVRAALHLARHDGSWCKARDIAEDRDIPETYLPQVLGDLVRNGIARSLSGPHGGYRLARPAAEVSLLQVIEATGGPLRSHLCVLRNLPCQEEDVCAVHDAWSDAQAAFVAHLRGASLASIAAREVAVAVIASHRAGPGPTDDGT